MANNADLIHNFLRAHGTFQAVVDYIAEVNARAGPVDPARHQGRFSYTAAARDGRVVVQFRSPKERLHGWLVLYAQRIYPGLVPNHEDQGPFVFEGRILPLTESMFEDPFVLRVVSWFASFFACSWINRPDIPVSIRSHLYGYYTAELDSLLLGLPEIFHSKILHIRNHLHHVLAPDYPMTVNHMDLNGSNMFFDDLGNLNGVVDWATAHISPFGLSLFAIEHALGYLEQGPTRWGWTYLNNQKQLRDFFWTSLFRHIGWQTPEMIEQLKERMLVAAKLGCFLQYGRDRETGEVATEGSYNFAFLMEHMVCT